jgi:GntR family carbon starvation induced transcriptional regulator
MKVSSQAQDEALTQTDRAYQALRAAIVRCEYEPGARLRVDELAQKLSVSSSPLREALSRLAGQDLVQALENRGFRVAPLSLEGIADLTRVRLLIECETLMDAMENGNDAWESDVVAAAHRLALAEQRLNGGSAILDDDWSERHRAFHMAIYSGASSSLLRSMVGNLFDAAERYRRFSASHRKFRRNKNDEHQELMRVILSRDKKKAVELLKQHISSTQRNVTAAFQLANGKSA